jgi:hypothetical protein
MTTPDPRTMEERTEAARRDALGRQVREAWVEWAREQPLIKPSWVVPYDELSEPDKEADRRIGDALTAGLVARCTELEAHLRATTPVAEEALRLMSEDKAGYQRYADGWDALRAQLTANLRVLAGESI